MTATLTSDRPDTREMVVVHDVFRRFLRDLPVLVAAAADGDHARATRLADTALEIATALEHHHCVEDELLWPRLLERVEADRGFVLRAEEQHERIHELLGRTFAQAHTYRARATGLDRDALAGTLAELGSAAAEHMADEEAHILPLVQAHLSVAEWNELGERGRASMPKNRLLIQLGWILDGLDPAGQRAFLATMPAPARLLWRLIGRRAWRKERDAVYGL